MQLTVYDVRLLLQNPVLENRKNKVERTSSNRLVGYPWSIYTAYIQDAYFHESDLHVETNMPIKKKRVRQGSRYKDRLTSDSHEKIRDDPTTPIWNSGWMRDAKKNVAMKR